MNIGTTRAIFKSSGIVPEEKGRLIKVSKGIEISCLRVFSIAVGMLKGPVALFKDNPLIKTRRLRRFEETERRYWSW